MRVQRLKEMDIEIIEDGGGGKDFSHVKEEDVVILPAFGASVQEMRLLNDKGVRIVDTTCPWVAKARAACWRRTRARICSDLSCVDLSGIFWLDEMQCLRAVAGCGLFLRWGIWQSVADRHLALSSAGTHSVACALPGCPAVTQGHFGAGVERGGQPGAQGAHERHPRQVQPRGDRGHRQLRDDLPHRARPGRGPPPAIARGLCFKGLGPGFS